MQRKHMEPNRRFVIRNNKEGAGAQWNLLVTGRSLQSISEVDNEVPQAICQQNVTEADLDEQGRGDGREYGQIKDRSWEFRCDSTVHNTPTGPTTRPGNLYHLRMLPLLIVSQHSGHISTEATITNRTCNKPKHKEQLCQQNQSTTSIRPENLSQGQGKIQ